MKKGALCLLALLLATPHATHAADIPLPEPLRSAYTRSQQPEALLQSFLGIPYRDDGAVDDNGLYTLFANPKARFSTPGLNCSGFVLEASRLLLRENIPLATAMRDRLGDSGPKSPLGQDWDFGWDLIMNIAEGRSPRMLLPGGKSMDPAKNVLSGKMPRGFDLHAPETWQELPGRIRPGHMYLLSFSKDSSRKPYTLLHYHVGLLFRDPSGTLWLYHATGQKGSVNRRDIGSAEGRAAFLKSYANSGTVRKMIVVLEVPLPPAS